MITTERKVRSLGFIAGFLLLTNIVMLVFFIYLREGKKTMHTRENLVGNFLKNDIGFDDSQMTTYQDLRKHDMDSLKPYFTQLRASKDSFYRLVTQKIAADSDAVYPRAQVIGQKQILVDQQMLYHFKKVRSLCKPDQLPKFDSLFSSIIDRITNGRIKKNYKE